MIPRSITLRGFLCYKDKQVIDLDGCDLWVLAGRNGSGKSAIFDAMTFALFGAHRGGKRAITSSGACVGKAVRHSMSRDSSRKTTARIVGRSWPMATWA
jgi:DNA repair exonuclease SbcCD ATPase subunit